MELFCKLCNFCIGTSTVVGSVVNSLPMSVVCSVSTFVYSAIGMMLYDVLASPSVAAETCNKI